MTICRPLIASQLASRSAKPNMVLTFNAETAMSRQTHNAATDCNVETPKLNARVLNCSAILSSWCNNHAMKEARLFLAVMVSSTLLLLTAFVLMVLMVGHLS